METLAASSTVSVWAVTQGEEGGASLEIELAPVAGEREVLVDVRRVGRACLAPQVGQPK